MGKYLNPKADITFKLVFAENEGLMLSLLNAFIPLKKNGSFKSVTICSAELLPVEVNYKNSVVDVRCKSNTGETFIVEMQMLWASYFDKRVLFNALKVYAEQLKSRASFLDLKNVYSLNLVNHIFEPDVPDYYHVYRITDSCHHEKVIEGIELIFVELPKFLEAVKAGSEKELVPNSRNLWLRFLTEIDEKTETAPKALLDNPETNKALGIVEVFALTDEQRRAYDRYWDTVRLEEALYGAIKDAKEELMLKTKENEHLQGENEHLQGENEHLQGEKEQLQGEKEQLQEENCEIHQSLLRTAKYLKDMQVPLDRIMEMTGLSSEEIEEL